MYGKRSVAPTRLGIEMSQKIWLLSKAKPAAGSSTTTMLHSCQIDEAEELGEDRPARGCACAIARPAAFPLCGVLGVPAVDPAAAAMDEAGRPGRRGRRVRCGGRCRRGVQSVSLRSSSSPRESQRGGACDLEATYVAFRGFVPRVNSASHRSHGRGGGVVRFPGACCASRVGLIHVFPDAFSAIGRWVGSAYFALGIVTVPVTIVLSRLSPLIAPGIGA